jgi:cytochrome P450
MKTVSDPPELDPYSDEFQQRPFGWYRRLREDAPVYRVPGQDWYMVTTMELVREALRQPDTYSNVVRTGRRSEPPPEVAAEVAAIRAQGAPYVPALGLNDPPVHTRYRRLVNRAFTPRALGWMEPVVRTTAAELVDALPDGAEVDLVETVARPLPIYAILRILGLSDDRREDVVRWSDAATASLGARLTPQQWLDTERDVLAFQQAISFELDERRQNPRVDLLSSLVQAAEDGSEQTQLGTNELVWLVRELLVAGNETTTRAIAETVLHLNGDPALWRRLREDSGYLATVIEEGLRLSSPAIGMFRRVTRDTELGGVQLPEGTTVFLVYGSANRDERLYPDPDEFQPDRVNLREHVTFGHGIHVCVGAGLARMEASAVLGTMAERLDAVRVTDTSDLHYIPSFFIRGLQRLPVVVRRRSAAEVDLEEGTELPGGAQIPARERE